MRLPLLDFLVDERFLMHRLRSSSLAGMIGGALAISLFAYRYYHDGVWSGDLLAVGVTFVAVKMGLFTWYRIKR
jgi:hypothetical protein